MSRFICILVSWSLLTHAIRAEENSATRLSAQTVLTEITAQLAHLAPSSADLRLDFIRAWTPPNTTAQQWKIEVVQTSVTAIANNIVPRVRIEADSRSLGEFTIPMRAELLVDAWTTREPITRNATIEPAQLELRRVNLLRERDALPATTALATFSTTRPLPVGTLITWRDVARRPLVHKGENVEVIAASGPLSITMKALAMQDGAIGDTIRIRNPESRRDFTGTVTAENKVRVSF